MTRIRPTAVRGAVRELPTAPHLPPSSVLAGALVLKQPDSAYFPVPWAVPSPRLQALSLPCLPSSLGSKVTFLGALAFALLCLPGSPALCLSTCLSPSAPA